jgi:hypothetical protein
MWSEQMKFKLTTANFRYTKEQSEWLSRFGFAFKDSLHPVQGCEYEIDDSVEASIEVETLEELLTFVNDIGVHIKDGWKTSGRIVLSQSEIIIYDSWIE